MLPFIGVGLGLLLILLINLLWATRPEHGESMATFATARPVPSSAGIEAPLRQKKKSGR